MSLYSVMFNMEIYCTRPYCIENPVLDSTPAPSRPIRAFNNRVLTAFLGAKQEGLASVNFLNILIVSCKTALRIPIFFLVIFKLDRYFLF
jgi:hypothetical protein